MKYKILIILGILTALLFSSGITYSIFSSGSELTTVDQKIAKFVFETKQLDHIELNLSDITPGNTLEYQFYVTNNHSVGTSDVTLNYQITIKTFHLMPLTIELYKIGNNEELLMKCDETYTRNEKNELVCNSKIQEIDYSNEVMDNYKLKVAFPETYNSEEYADLIDYLNVEIKSWQKTS